MKKIINMLLLLLLCMAMNLNAMEIEAKILLDLDDGHKRSDIFSSEAERDDRGEEEGEGHNDQPHTITLPIHIWSDIIRFSDEDALKILSGATVDSSIEILKKCVGGCLLVIDFKRDPQTGLLCENKVYGAIDGAEQKKAFYSYIKRRLALRLISPEIKLRMKDLFPQLEDICFNIVARHQGYIDEFLKRLIKKKSLHSDQYALLNLFCRFGYIFHYKMFRDLVQASKNQNYCLSQFFLDHNLLSDIRHTPLVKAILLNDLKSLRTIISLCQCNFENYGFIPHKIWYPVANNLSALDLAAIIGNMTIFEIVLDHFNNYYSTHRVEGGPLLSPDRINQAFVYACKYNSKDVVQFLINKNIDVNLLCSSIQNYNTALVKAVVHGSWDAMDALLSCENTNVNIKDNKGNTPLIAAASKGYLRAVKELICCGAKINEANHKGDTALLVAIFSNNLEIVNALVQHSDININCQNLKGWTPLINAACVKSLKMLNVLLLCPTIHPNIRNRDGITALMMAIKVNENHEPDQDCKSIDLVEALLRHPAIDLEVQNNEGKTALMLAQENNYDNIVERLMEYQSKKTNL